ncbi:MAG: histidine phosphatase family protein, partial [Clostridia bacterium]|nr:histidine phosphatase family protein [Clostridia bacterium]
YLKDTHIEAVLSSTLTRAKQTAAPIAGDRGLAVLERAEFMEMNFGDWEGLPLDEVEARYPGSITEWKNEMHKTVCPGGESMVECYDRAVKALYDTAEEYKGRDICIVSHGALIKCMLCHLHGWEVTDIRRAAWADNASVTTIENKDGKLTLLAEPYSAHMGQFATGVSKAMAGFKKD